MRVVLKPAGVLLVIGAMIVLAIMALVKPQKEKIAEAAEFAPIAGLKSKKQNKDKLALFEGKDTVRPVDLSEVGTLDWVHWGLGGPDKVNRKDSENKRISDFTFFNDKKNVQTEGKRGPARGLWWHGGTPTEKSAITYAGVHVGEQNGFRFSVEADKTPRTLRVYAGGYMAEGEFSAWRSDGTPAKVAVQDIALASGFYTRVYTIRFQASEPKQRLNVVWRKKGGPGNISLQAAALQ